MPKKNKYPWYAPRNCFRKQIKLPDGAYKTLYAKTEDEMDQKVRQIQQELAAGLDTGVNPTFAQYAVKWFPLNTSELSSSRVRDYRVAINKYIAPVLAVKHLREITADDGKLVLLGLAGKSRSLQSNVVFVLKRIFDDAEENGIIAASPFRRLKPAGKPPDEKTPLSDEQVTTLLNATKSTRVYSFIMLALYAGLRREEILGLRWNNVYLDTPAPYIAVRERVTFAPGGSAIHEAVLKSKAARRDIPLPPQLIMQLSNMEHVSEFVIPGASGRPQSNSAFNSMWRSVLCRKISESGGVGSTPTNHPTVFRSIDFHVSPHILRHTYLTNLCRSGLNLKVIQYLAGHSKAQLTLNIYIHATENRPEDLSEIIANAFKTKPEKDTKTDAKVIDITQLIVAQ